MLAGLAAVIQDIGVGTAGFFEGVGKDGHSVEGTVIVDGLGNPLNRAVVPGQPRKINGDGAEEVAEYAAQCSRLILKFDEIGGTTVGRIHCLGSFSHRIEGCAPIR